MKRLLNFWAVAALILALPAGCSKSDSEGEGKNPGPKPKAPTVSMVGADIDAVHEIAAGMKVKVAVEAPGGVTGFVVDIESPALTKDVLTGLGLDTHMDLVNPATDMMATLLKNFGFPVKDAVSGKTELSFDISTLIPMIAQLYGLTSDHNFKLTITDAASQTVVKTLKFHLTGSSAAYNKDADLWKNTASLTVKIVGTPATPGLEYKKSSETDWQQAKLTKNSDNTYTAAIAPVWKDEAAHVSGAKQYSLDGKTGVFAGHTYDYRVINGGKAVAGSEGIFKADAGQTIPGGNMERWGKLTVKDADNNDIQIDCALADDGSPYWGSGNNFMTPLLCSPEKLADNTHVAKLQGVLALGDAAFAAGNLFAGVFDFDYEAYNGYARFGQKYDYKARPIALKVRLKATIGKITMTGVKEDANEGDVDRGRIFVCMTDWTERHSVMSGAGVFFDPSKINAFDPEKDAETTEGKIMAYGVKWIDASVADWTEIVIPILYKDKDGAKPAANNYSLVFSAAASAYGDYLCGGPDNNLSIDNIEWVY